MRKKKKNHEEHMDETWLLPYSDMLTLLLALFITMFAMGQIDKEKFNNVAKQFNVIFSGGSGISDGDGNSIVSIGGPDGSDTTGMSDSQIEDTKMTEIKKNLEEEIEQEGYGDRIKIDLNGEGLEIAIQDVALFDSGDAEVLSDVSPILLKISNMLKELDNQIRVVGYTDNVPISNNKFRSNWDLSASRAINVMDFMVSYGGIKEENVSIQAYGQYKPKTSNDTEEGKAKNRRVEIYVVRNFPVDEEEEAK